MLRKGLLRQRIDSGEDHFKPKSLQNICQYFGCNQLPATRKVESELFHNSRLGTTYIQSAHIFCQSVRFAAAFKTWNNMYNCCVLKTAHIHERVHSSRPD